MLHEEAIKELAYRYTTFEVIAMAKSATVFARVEPEIKEQAEEILTELGIPMSNAVSLFLRQIVIQRGIPFSLRLPRRGLLDISTLSDEELNAEIQKGFDDAEAGRTHSSAEVHAIMDALMNQ